MRRDGFSAMGRKGQMRIVWMYDDSYNVMDCGSWDSDSTENNVDYISKRQSEGQATPQSMSHPCSAIVAPAAPSITSIVVNRSHNTIATLVLEKTNSANCSLVHDTLPGDRAFHYPLCWNRWDRWNRYVEASRRKSRDRWGLPKASIWRKTASDAAKAHSGP